jgi:hypothetical protein
MAAMSACAMMPAQQPSSINDRYAPNLIVLHRRDHLVKRRIGRHRDDRLRHARVGGAAGRVRSLGDNPTDDIPIGDDPDRMMERSTIGISPQLLSTIIFAT